MNEKSKVLEEEVEGGEEKAGQDGPTTRLFDLLRHLNTTNSTGNKRMFNRVVSTYIHTRITIASFVA